MRTQYVLLASLLAALYGCQPKTPVQQDAAPAEGQQRSSGATGADTPVAGAAAESSAAPAVPVGQAASTAAASAAVPVRQPKSAPAVAVIKAEPAPVAGEAKPEMKSESAVSEADAMPLVKKNGCFACHAIDKKVVGPAWKDVAAKYRGDAGAEARIMDKIANGGSGVWGATKMPAFPQASEAERRTLARFVLSLK